jgi:hypothetical protein
VSEGNGDGVIRIGRKGTIKVALGDGEPFEFDAIAAQNQWRKIDDGFRNEEGEIIPERRDDYYYAVVDFATAMSKTEKCPDGTPNITLAEGLEFLKVVTVECNRLKDFFRVEAPDAESSPESSPTVRYSA